ncbi:uncharacterized protein LOC111100057 [Crassostrea virginica]
MPSEKSKHCSTPGYFGSFCNLTCPRGTFGRDCGGNCSGLCPFESCHHEFGCTTGSSSVLKTTESGEKQIYIEKSIEMSFPTTTSFTYQQNNTLFITEHDETKNKTIYYMLIRIGIGIILLFAICLLLYQMYKKWNLKKTYQKKKQLDIHDQNQTMESVYQDIGDGVEIEPQQALTTLSFEVERPVLPPRVLPAKSCNTCSTLAIEHTECNLYIPSRHQATTI